MLGADVSGDPADRTAADNQTVRNVFVIGPDKKVKLVLVYPMTTGRNFDEVLRVIDSLAADREAQGLDAGQLEERRGRRHRRLGVGRPGARDLPGRLGVAEAVHPDRAAAELSSVERPRPAAGDRRSLREAPGWEPHVSPAGCRSHRNPASASLCVGAGLVPLRIERG